MDEEKILTELNESIDFVEFTENYMRGIEEIEVAQRCRFIHRDLLRLKNLVKEGKSQHSGLLAKKIIGDIKIVNLMISFLKGEKTEEDLLAF